LAQKSPVEGLSAKHENTRRRKPERQALLKTLSEVEGSKIERAWVYGFRLLV
jgi:hypothetical protein